MDLSEGALVIMTHPFTDGHVVAEVQSVSKAMVKVLYFNSRGMTDEPKRRNLDSIVGLLDPNLSPEAARELLAIANSDRMMERREADIAYLNKVAMVTAD